MLPTAPDLRTSFPRSGRTILGGYVWLARLADKARARKAGTAGEYVAYCPVSLGFLDRLHVPRQEFEAHIDSDQTDQELVAFLDSRVSDTDREAANRWVLEDNADDLRQQDTEEGRAAPFIAVIKITVGAATMSDVVGKVAEVLAAESKELPGFLAAEILCSVDCKTIVILTEWRDHHAWGQSRYDSRVGEMIGSLYINSATIEFETYTRQGTFQKT